MAPVSVPHLTGNSYPLYDALPPELIESGKLSNLQLEGVLYACQRHQQMLHSGERAGFFIGDGAGVGKGRQIAGCIMDSYSRDRRKHVWFSVSSDLSKDAERDLHDLGCHINVIDGCQAIDKHTLALGLTKEYETGVLFSTYTSLVSEGRRGKASRKEQIIKWCGGEEFDGLIIFDECHKAKNFQQADPDTAKQKGSKVAQAVVEIQSRMPKARVLYCSATGVSELKHMAFMQRLGLWGPSTSFASFDDFSSTISKNGLGALEQLAMEMKASGMYLARGLSFSEAEFAPLDVMLTEEQEALYDAAAAAWSNLRDEMLRAERLGATSKPRIWGSYWSAHQRFFKQLCIAMKVDTVVKDGTQALAEGNAVVIGLQTTGEASMVAAIGACAGLDPSRVLPGFVSTSKEIVKAFISQHFPTTIKPPEGAPPGTLPKEHADCVRAKATLLERVEALALPENSLDLLIDRFGGPDAVAEMTGRSNRVVRGRDGKLRLEARHSDSKLDNLNVAECKAFMSGKKFVAIISDAASTGISLHADCRVANQRRRVHYTIELPWSADKAIQQLGRSHRSNAACGPVYKLLTTNVGGERRFAATIAARLESLGALTKGDRRAASGQDMSKYNVNTVYGKSAAKAVAAAATYMQLVEKVTAPAVVRRAVSSVPPDSGDNGDRFISLLDTHREPSAFLEVIGTSVGAMGFTDPEKVTPNALLNRMLGLAVHQQALLFANFVEALEALVAKAKLEGRFSEGVVDIVGQHIDVTAGPVQLTPGIFQYTVAVDRGISFEQALEKVLDPSKQAAFYVSRRKMYGRQHFIVARPKPTDRSLFFITRPNTGESRVELTTEELNGSYKRVDPAVAAAGAVAPAPDPEENPAEATELRTEPGRAGGVTKGEAALENALTRADDPGHADAPARADDPAQDDSLTQEDDPAQGDDPARADDPARGKEPAQTGDGLKFKRRFELLKSAWSEAYDRTGTQCVHFAKCKAGRDCTIGKRVSEVILLCGKIVALWTPLSQALKDMKASLRYNQRSIKIVRLVTTNGQRLVGFRSPPELVAKIPQLVAFREAPPKAPATVKMFPESWYRSQMDVMAAAQLQALLGAGMAYADAQAAAKSYAAVQVEQWKETHEQQHSHHRAAYLRQLEDYHARKRKYERAQQPLPSEPASAIHKGAMKKASRKPVSMLTFFKRKEDPKAAGGGSALSRKAPAAASPEAVVMRVQAAPSGSKSTGESAGKGPSSTPSGWGGLKRLPSAAAPAGGATGTKGKKRRKKAAAHGKQSSILVQPPTEDQIAQLVQMGFDRSKCIAALKRKRNNVEAALLVLLDAGAAASDGTSAATGGSCPNADEPEPAAKRAKAEAVAPVPRIAAAADAVTALEKAAEALVARAVSSPGPGAQP